MSSPAVDTIVAISSPPGQGGVGLVRLSGPDSIAIGRQIFICDPILGRRIRHVEFGRILDGNREIDTGLAWILKAPRSYTGEDTVEISCHGSTFVLESLVQAAISAGATLAAPGEFTRRAFLNGRIDLLQAEAVIDLIQAGNRHSLDTAYGHSSGRLSHLVRNLKERTVDIISHIEVAIDFSEEEVDGLDRESVLCSMQSVSETILRLLDTFEGHLRRRDGFMVALVGPPNVGKSTLLNVLLGEDRAIVTPIPGTTRDIIEGRTIIGGQEIRFVDTAGLHEARDLVEIEGIKRTMNMVEEADLLIGVFDRSLDWLEEHRFVYDLISQNDGLFVLNKSDLNKRLRLPIFGADGIHIFETSAISGEGIDHLKEGILQTLPQVDLKEEIVITRQRHRDLLLRSHQHFTRASEQFTLEHLDELAVQELHNALESLGELLGEDVGEDVLDRIFSDFCIGK